MPYTINKLASLAGVSVRTLHYYDDLDLLKPTAIAKNGYRQYGEAELIRLQQILFFKELDFSLSEIKQILNKPGYDLTKALHDQKKLLKLKRRRLDGLIKSIDKTIKSMTDDKPLNAEEMYNPFKDDDVKQYQAEIKERWGNTDAYKQSMERVGRMTKQEMDDLKAKGKEFTQKLADAMDKPTDSPEVQALIAEHYKGIQFFYDCPLSIYRNLGQMYVADPRFTAYYEKFKPGLAIYMRDAIAYFCDVREKTKQSNTNGSAEELTAAN